MSSPTILDRLSANATPGMVLSTADLARLAPNVRADFLYRNRITGVIDPSATGGAFVNPLSPRIVHINPNVFLPSERAGLEGTISHELTHSRQFLNPLNTVAALGAGIVGGKANDYVNFRFPGFEAQANLVGGGYKIPGVPETGYRWLNAMPQDLQGQFSGFLNSRWMPGYRK